MAVLGGSIALCSLHQDVTLPMETAVLRVAVKFPAGVETRPMRSPAGGRSFGGLCLGQVHLQGLGLYSCLSCTYNPP